ncbi:MAG: putative porin [Pseudoflavonifractor sp.]|nr:putative porin [Alloprevotella sp.]MCM1116362.1 putative porin [Pseudoflavonifractor sp.]
MKLPLQKAIIFFIYFLLGLPAIAQQSDGAGQQSHKLPPQSIYAWEMTGPLGSISPASVDTLLHNYYLQAVPSDASLAWASTGNYGAEGINMIYFERPRTSPFFFRDALAHWLPALGKHKFYNSRIPFTLLSYNTGGGKESAQDRLKGVFSGNVNKSIQVGADIDYIYSKGSYANQSVKAISWGAFGSYMGDKYELQAFFNAWNSLNKENGGITDDLYITDPAELQGGISTIESHSIPTRLSAAHTRVTGAELMLNNKYKMGFWRALPPDSIMSPEGKLVPDTIERSEFVPVSAVTWTFNYQKGRHMFRNQNPSEARDFWENAYLSRQMTNDVTRFHSITNTLALSLIEGFHKYAKFGLSAFVTHELRSYTQNPDSVTHPRDPAAIDPSLTPYPLPEQLAEKANENFLWVGGRLSKTRGSLIRYDAMARFGLLGRAIGEVEISGNASTRIPLAGDTLSLEAHGGFSNEAAPYLLNNYVSNHFIWHNDFGKTRRVSIGASLSFPKTKTRLGFDLRNVQNLVYFDSLSCPVQHGSNVQVISASLRQDFRLGILNWENKLVWQKSSDSNVLPLPSLALYSNLYILFRVATLQVQMGVDCDWYSKYYAYDYQPATTTFHVQDKVKVGNYPFMNAYINMKLSKARFYLLFSHINQGSIGGDNYFALPHYPMNPRRLMLGVSVDFTN